MVKKLPKVASSLLKEVLFYSRAFINVKILTSVGTIEISCWNRHLYFSKILCFAVSKYTLLFSYFKVSFFFNFYELPMISLLKNILCVTLLIKNLIRGFYLFASKSLK